MTQVRDHCLGLARTGGAPLAGGRYTRLFPELPTLAIEPQLLRAIGRAGGPCDATSRRPSEARAVAAGRPVFGQYLAHDLTADRSPLTHHDDEELLRNARSARLDLELLYGEGTVANPYLYSRRDPARLLLGRGGSDDEDDLPRNAEGVALAGDPRQDSHVLISQMQVAMIRAHNRLVDRLREDGVPDADLFGAARRSLTWHYQYAVLHDYLPETIGQERAARLLAEGPRHFRPDGAVAIPLEFADAADRFGHSQMRDSYRLRPGGAALKLMPDLMGFGPIPADRVVHWPLLLDVPGQSPAQRAMTIDGRLPNSLVHLPLDLTGAVDEDDQSSLAVRDLLRGTATGLPSGEAVARRVGEAPLDPDEIGLANLGWSGETPLWYYLLREAAVREDGERLGPVGSLIVGEVLLAVIDGDPLSQRSADPGWRPSLPGRQPGRFTLTDLLAPASPT
jgi:Animal haem peroxidase